MSSHADLGGTPPGAVPTVLLTGFEPFGGDGRNPSGDAVRIVADSWLGPERLVTDVLPVTFAGAARRMRELIAQYRPSIVVAAGLAAGRASIAVERVAVNLVDARIADNAGEQPVDEASVSSGPAAHFATLPVKAIVAALRSAGVPAELSHSAGTFVCNHVFYTAMDAASAAHDHVRAGFIHVPWSVGDAPRGEPELPLEQIADGLRIALRTALDTPVDVAVPGGSLH